MKITQGYDKEGKPVDDLEDAVFIIEAEYDEDGNLIHEVFAESEESPGVLPAS